MSADNSSDPDVDPDEALMAKALGFSSFGASRPSKKRRFNPSNSDEAGTSSNALPLGNRAAPRNNAAHIPMDINNHQSSHKNDASNMTVPPRPSSNRSSNIPLHPASPPTASSYHTTTVPTNAAEIALSDSDREEEGNDSSDPGPQYIDTSLPVGVRPSSPSPIAEEAADIQARIEAIVAAGNARYMAPPRTEGGPPTFLPPPPPTQRVDYHGFQDSHRQISGGGFRGGNSGRARGGGGGVARDNGKEWWENYYDDAFNMNPWKPLEDKLGLAPRGTWLTRGQRVE